MKFHNEKYKILTINTKKENKKMNFYEMQQNILNNKPTIEKGEYLSVVSRIARKLGEKSNKYNPLIKFVSRNENMLRLLEELIEETSTAQASRMNPIFKS